MSPSEDTRITGGMYYDSSQPVTEEGIMARQALNPPPRYDRVYEEALANMNEGENWGLKAWGKCPRCAGFLIYDSDLIGMVCWNCGRCYYLFRPCADRESRERHLKARPVDITTVGGEG